MLIYKVLCWWNVKAPPIRLVLQGAFRARNVEDPEILVSIESKNPDDNYAKVTPEGCLYGLVNVQAERRRYLNFIKGECVFFVVAAAPCQNGT